MQSSENEKAQSLNAIALCEKIFPNLTWCDRQLYSSNQVLIGSTTELDTTGMEMIMEMIVEANVRERGTFNNARVSIRIPRVVELISSPDERGISLEKALLDVREKWDAIALLMSQANHNSTNSTK